MNVIFRTMCAGTTEKRGAFKIFIINGAKKMGTPKTLLKEQLGGPQKR